MAADIAGNDVSAVAVPVTGFIGVAPYATPLPSSLEGSSESLDLDPAFGKVGLLKQDGGPQWSWAADGDPLEFWQEGYKIPTGLANVTCTVTAAQTDNFVRSLVYGKQPDENGMIVVDGGGHATQYVLFTEEIFKNRAIRRRGAPTAQIQSVTEDKSTRGEILGYQIVFGINFSESLGGHFNEWLLLPPSGGGS